MLGCVKRFVTNVQKFLYILLYIGGKIRYLIKLLIKNIKKIIMGNIFRKSEKMTKTTFETLSIVFNDGVNAENTLYRVKRGSLVHLNPGPSCLGKEIAVYTNYPLDDKTGFVRTKYRILTWHSKRGEKLTSTVHPYAAVTDVDIGCEVKMNRSGTYHFYFMNHDNKTTNPNGSLYVQVEPVLHVGPIGAQKIIPLDSIRCQTVLSKCLGPLNKWESKLRVTKESGYNLIHFTPIQELGPSRSGYSLKNQLKVNPDFGQVSFDDIEKMIKKCRQEWGMASICDIVLNHTANESEWLEKYPDATYSCKTSPYLRPAFMLDAMLVQCGRDIDAGALEHVGVPQIIENEDHLLALKHQLHTVYLAKLNVHEFYQCNANKYVKEFIDEIRKREPPKKVTKMERFNEITIKQDTEYRRLKSTINMELAIERFNSFHADCFDEDARLKKCSEMFRNHLESLNEVIYNEIQGYLTYAIDNILAGVRYERVDVNGPKLRKVTKKYPIFSKYFTHDEDKPLKSLEEIEESMCTDEGSAYMAHNGWVMGSDDPLKDFAREQSGRGNVYLKRELIAWGDSVKLRFGDKPEDSPELWAHMREYVEMTAKMFDGVRLDNCHSTPLHVAEYMLDAARKINPELYVVAELFTNSDSTDNIFVNRLGITSLIREALSAWDSHEEGRLVYRYGGEPVGAFYTSPKRPYAPTIAHALFMDLTHDNPSPVEKRSIFDMLPSAALVSMACCATGSNRGYDELVPHHIHVVDEERQYQEWDNGVDFKTGIIAVKRALNLLHGQLAEEGFSQVFVDQMNPDVVAITRHSPITHESVILVAHTSFSSPNVVAGPTGVRSLRFEGHLDEIILEASMTHKFGNQFDKPLSFKQNEEYINGVTEYIVELNEHIPLDKSKIFNHAAFMNGAMTQLDFVNLRPGSVVVIRASQHQSVRANFKKLHELVSSFHNESGPNYDDLNNIVSKLNLIDLNRALYSCEEEEKDLGFGGGAYNVPNYGSLVYCGLQGFISPLTEIAPKNDLGHPFCDNLRNGDWMMDYCAHRLGLHKTTEELANWMRSNFGLIKGIPRYLVPSYFDAILNGLYNSLINQCYNLMSDFIQNGSTFPQSLGLASLQFLAVCNSANLPKLSPNISPPLPPERCTTLSAGLPHFSTGYMRCWGRDTFIAMRGLLILTGRYNEARYIILGFAACMRHGLIPNLLDNGTKPRFNCRDAVWWWLNSIKQYVEEVPNGNAILGEKVSRIFPTDQSNARKPGEYDQFLYDVMQETLSVHFQGLIYRERNAGSEIDAHMTDNGFNNQIGVKPDTGFVFGGNAANCGTWMDKMGSSEKSGNRGKPSTPRDGSAVELVGLQASVLKFMNKASENGWIPYKQVERVGKNDQKTTWTYKEWANIVIENFEKQFHVGNEKVRYSNKPNIYKDTVGSTQPWTDFQLRCNFPIAMVVAPELFDTAHAWAALEQARKYILGPLGMKTLDPDDWAYKGNYDNSNDSNDETISHGANYHQGPEWLWPIGFYLRARLIFAAKYGKLKETVAETWGILQAHLNELQTSHWRGLPELTNANGSYCSDSCRTQAWSIACIMEVIYDLHHIERQY